MFPTKEVREWKFDLWPTSSNWSYRWHCLHLSCWSDYTPSFPSPSAIRKFSFPDWWRPLPHCFFPSRQRSKRNRRSAMQTYHLPRKTISWLMRQDLHLTLCFISSTEMEKEMVRAKAFGRIARSIFPWILHRPDLSKVERQDRFGSVWTGNFLPFFLNNWLEDLTQ